MGIARVRRDSCKNFVKVCLCGEQSACRKKLCFPIKEAELLLKLSPQQRRFLSENVGRQRKYCPVG